MKPSQQLVDPRLATRRMHVPSYGFGALVCKRALDVAGALVFFLLFGWVFLLVWIAVLWTTGGPAVYRHMRVGKHGKEFPCLKFRSMVVNSDQVLKELLASDPVARAEWNTSFKLRDDPRITAFGRFIRKTSLDELPQFWNVLVGDMSLVGPRPVVRKELDDYYGPYTPVYCSGRPGITGPWQVGGRSDLSYSERVALDVDYVHNWSISGDLRLLVRTIGAFVNHKGSY